MVVYAEFCIGLSIIIQSHKVDPSIGIGKIRSRPRVISVQDGNKINVVFGQNELTKLFVSFCSLI